MKDFNAEMRYPGEDPWTLFSRLFTKLSTLWMRLTYPFAGFGRDVSIHYSCELPRSVSNRIKIGNSVYIAPETWLTSPERSLSGPPALILGNSCKIGRRCTFSAKNLIHLEDDVLLGPSVLIMDHNHEFLRYRPSDPRARYDERRKVIIRAQLLARVTVSLSSATTANSDLDEIA